MVSRKGWQKALVIVTNGRGQNQELAEAVAAKFNRTTFKQWRVLSVGPKAVQKANENFIVSDFSSIISQDTLKALHKQCKDFNYEIDSILDFSSDVSEGMP
jgi:hypothetical protein